MPNLFNLVDGQESLSVRRSKWQIYSGKVEEGLRQTPSAPSTSMFNVMRDELDKDAQDIDDAIASLRAEIELLESGKLRVEQIRGRLSAVLAPIRRLPDEILHMIFKFCLSSDDTPLNVESFCDAHSCFCLVHPTWARVCHGLSWALLVPSLEIHNVQEKDNISFAMEHCARRLLHVDYVGDIASWERLLSFSDRISSLQIAVTRQQWDMLLPVAGRLHHVHSIVLDAMDDDCNEPWSDVLSHIPNLVSVSFVGSNEQGILTSVPLGRLTHFSDTRSRAVVPPDLYLDILQHNPSLISVDLRYAIPAKNTGANLTPRNLVMPNLRRLTVGDRTLLQSFASVPVLEHLELALRWSVSSP
ncbi:hypothetical protein BDZ89DRAFT_1165612 [Hymenopellis radicata]|nr:hypothetical protein BDZ89DRAFT_1165612 [Hymenopellis radicata]